MNNEGTVVGPDTTPISPCAAMTDPLRDHRLPRASSWCLLALIAGVLLQSDIASAHVKWFSKYSFSDQPLGFEEVLSTNFYWLLGLSVFVIAILILLEERMMKVPWIARIDGWFAEKADYVLYVMRIGVGVTLVWCWQAGRLLAPELGTSLEWMIWLQLVVAVLLVFPRTIAAAGVGILILYFCAISQFGLFHMLDYLLYAGVGWFFIAEPSSNRKLHITALPALYAALGFCLIWLGIEKLVYPSWSKLLLQEHPVLALGMSHDFFVTAAAMVEISLGFMILVCLQERLLALFISLLFVLTTLVFGKEEVVGHTLIHTILIVFLFAGPGKATPPLHWVRRLSLRIPVTLGVFVALLAVLMVPYTQGSSLLFKRSNQMANMDMHDQLIEAGQGAESPRLAIAMHKDPVSGWNVELITDNFEFAPASASRAHVPGEGHAHLMIDGEKVARVYGPWYHIPNLPVGLHRISVTLNANNHAQLTVNGKPVEAMAEIEVLAD